MTIDAISLDGEGECRGVSVRCLDRSHDTAAPDETTVQWGESDCHNDRLDWHGSTVGANQNAGCADIFGGAGMPLSFISRPVPNGNREVETLRPMIAVLTLPHAVIDGNSVAIITVEILNKMTAGGV
jgi:hypothetical protein